MSDKITFVLESTPAGVNVSCSADLDAIAARVAQGAECTHAEGHAMALWTAYVDAMAREGHPIRRVRRLDA